MKLGYQRTEVGVIPEDWEVKSANQLGNPVRGGSPRPAGDSRYFNGSYIPWLTVAALTNIPACQLIVSETESRLTEEGSLQSRTLIAGTLIIANSGATLGVAKILSIKCCANDGIAALLNLRKRVCSKYLAQFINSKTNYLRDTVATGNGQPNLNTELIGNFKIPLPPTLAEQEAIAEALSDADALIESLEQLLTKKRQIKKGAMQELLTGKKRLPQFDGKWQTTALECVVEIKNGATPSTQISAFWDGSIPWCRPTDITGTTGKYLLTTERSITAEGLASCGATLLPAGTLLLCSRATIGEIKIATSPVCTNQGFKSLVCKDGVSNEFLYYVLVTLKPQLLKHASGSTFLEIGKRDVAAIQVMLPSYAEQSAIANILSDMDAEITALEAKLSKARQIKQGMMQELLTGRIRLL